MNFGNSIPGGQTTEPNKVSHRQWSGLNCRLSMNLWLMLPFSRFRITGRTGWGTKRTGSQVESQVPSGASSRTTAATETNAKRGMLVLLVFSWPCICLSFLSLKQQKYFDSGDYNMAKALNKNNKRTPSTLSHENQGGSTPNPDNVCPTGSVILESPPPTGEAIPTPDHLSTRKASIHVQSKLVTGEFA